MSHQNDALHKNRIRGTKKAESRHIKQTNATVVKYGARSNNDEVLQ